MGYIVTWPKVSLTVNGKRKVLEQGATVPEGISAIDRDNLVSFGAISGAPAIADPEGSEVPTPGSAAAVLAEVGDDKELAQAALEEEQAKEKPRKGLVADLEKILAAS